MNEAAPRSTGRWSPLLPCRHDPVATNPGRECDCPKTSGISIADTDRIRPNEGVKFDADKPRYELIPPEALDGLAKVLTFGAQKYAPRNWEKGMVWGRVFGAAMWHLWAWWRGENTDPESGLSHLHHAACCIAFLQAYEVRKCGTDDRGQK